MMFIEVHIMEQMVNLHFTKGNICYIIVSKYLCRNFPICLARFSDDG